MKGRDLYEVFGMKTGRERDWFAILDIAEGA
jgi:hypothetical protein